MTTFEEIITLIMKKLILMAALLLPLCLSAQNQTTPFYTREEAPHLENVIPAPPQLTDPLFQNDWNQYLWGKSIRDTERGEQAVKDAKLGGDFFFKRYSEAMGINTMTKEDYPILYELLKKAHYTEMEAGASAKQHFSRVRPYQQFKEESGVPKSENPTDFTSYPSGHTHAAWLTGMIMTAVAPEYTEQIMKAAYEVGQSRVIVGYHYQSDVDAGRICASVTFARLCSMPEFLTMLEKAKKEFAKNEKLRKK